MANYGENGRIEFNKLWNLMNKKELNKQWLKIMESIQIQLQS